MKKALSLVEVLVSVSIFGLMSLFLVNIFINNIDQSQNTKKYNTYLNEARFIRQNLNDFLIDKKIDYEQYFQLCVQQPSRNETCPILGFNNKEGVKFGENIGLYKYQYYDFGVKPNGAPDDLSTVCQDNNGNVLHMPNNNCDTIYLPSADKITGKYLNSNAICATNFLIPSINNGVVRQALNLNCADNYQFTELYLKDETDNKYIIAQKFYNGKSFLSISKQGDLLIDTIDFNGQNLPDIQGDYSPILIREKENIDENSLYAHSVPFSSFNFNVDNLIFEFGPYEDPDLAFNELSENQLMAPFVKIKFTLKANESFSEKLSRRNTEIPIEIFKNL